MLLWVMAFFAVLIAAVGGLAAFFLQHNFESIREVNALTDRSKQVDVINSDMLRARVNLMVAARRRNRAGAAARIRLATRRRPSRARPIC